MSYNSGISQRVRNQTFFNNTINEDYSVQETNLSLIANLKYVQDYITNFINSVGGYLPILNPNFQGTMTSSTQGNINISSLSVPTITSKTNFIQNPTINNNLVEYNIIGEIIMSVDNNPPNNFVLCDGASLNINTYPKLFQLIGYNYGGSGAFYNLPNFQSAFPIGANGLINNSPASNFATGNGSDGAFNTFTTTYKIDNPLITVITQHSHDYTDPSHSHNMTLINTPFFPVEGDFPVILPCLKYEYPNTNPVLSAFTGIKILNYGGNMQQTDPSSNLNGVNFSAPYVSTFFFICCQ